MSNFLDRDLILIDSHASNSNEALEQLGLIMIQKGFANKDYVEGLLNREEEFPTGLSVEPFGVAIPHTDASFVKQSRIGIAILNQPVEFGEMGGNGTVEVKIVILLGLSADSDHLKALQGVIKLIQNKEFVSELASSQSKEDVYKLLERNLEIDKEEV